jgi:uncharacterized protein YraI
MRKTSLFCSLLMAVVLMATTLVQAQSTSVVTTTRRNVNLRSGPGTQYAQIVVLPANTSVALDGRDAAGQWVRGISQSGASGWLSVPLVNISLESTFALPEIAVDAPLTVGAPSGLGEPASAPVTGGGGATASGTVSRLMNLRSGASTSSSIVAKMARGSVFSADGRDPGGQWLHGTSNGATGWAFAQYITGLDASGLAVLDTGTVAAAPSGGGGLPAPVVSNGPVSGFSYGGHILNLSDRTINAMRSAGMTWVKVQIRYAQGQDPATVAGVITDAHNKGFRILLGIVGHPSELNNNNYFNDYANFVSSAAILGADAIEIWNEPNIDREWPGGQISPQRYTELLAISYNTIKSLNPNTMVISGAPAPTGFFGGCGGGGCDDVYFVQGMAAAGAANYMDCIGLHYNEGIVPPTQSSGDPRSEHYTRYYGGMVNTYYNAFGGARPLCFTELGYLTPEGYGGLSSGFAWAGNTSIAEQAAWLDSAVSQSANSGIVRLLIVWNVDFNMYGTDPMAGYALIRADGSCPACQALGN